VSGSRMGKGIGSFRISAWDRCGAGYLGISTFQLGGRVVAGREEEGGSVVGLGGSGIELNECVACICERLRERMLSHDVDQV